MSHCPTCGNPATGKLGICFSCREDPCDEPLCGGCLRDCGGADIPTFSEPDSEGLGIAGATGPGQGLEGPRTAAQSGSEGLSAGGQPCKWCHGFPHAIPLDGVTHCKECCKDGCPEGTMALSVPYTEWWLLSELVVSLPALTLQESPNPDMF